MLKEAENTEIEKGLYELSYLLVPNLSEEELEKDRSSIEELIKKMGGEIKTSEGPLARTLAYFMEKHSSGKNYRYDSGYFGSIVFEGVGALLKELENDLIKTPHLLRELIIAIPPEALMPRSERRVSGRIEPEKFRPAPKAAGEEKMTEAEIDKTIEELVVN